MHTLGVATSGAAVSACSVQFRSQETTLSNSQSACILLNVNFEGKGKYFSLLKEEFECSQRKLFPTVNIFLEVEDPKLTTVYL